MKGVVLDQKLELWLIDSGSFWDQNGNGRINSIPTFSRSPFSCWWMDSMEKWITMKGIGSISGEPLYLVDCVSATTNGDPVVYCFFHCFIFPSRSLPEGTRRWSCVNCLVIVRWRGKCPKKRTPKKKENRKKRIRSENTWKKKKASIFFLGGGGEKPVFLTCFWVPTWTAGLKPAGENGHRTPVDCSAFSSSSKKNLSFHKLEHRPSTLISVPP